MSRDKTVKTNAMRILEREKVPFRVNLYECDEFIDGVHIADMLSQSYDSSFKTIVTKGKGGEYFVFCLPVDREIDLKKAAKSVGEKNVEPIRVKDITAVTGYIRGGCTPIGMKKRFSTVIHETAKEFDEIIISGGKIGVQLLLSPLDLAKVCNAKFEDIVL